MVSSLEESMLKVAVFMPYAIARKEIKICKKCQLQSSIDMMPFV